MFLSVLMIGIGYRMQSQILLWVRADSQFEKEVRNLFCWGVLGVIFLSLSSVTKISLELMCVTFMLIHTIICLIKFHKNEVEWQKITWKILDDLLLSMKMGESIHSYFLRERPNTDAIKQQKAVELIKNVLFAQQYSLQGIPYDSIRSLLNSLILCLNSPHRNLQVLENFRKSLEFNERFLLKRKQLSRPILSQVFVGSLMFVSLLSFQLFHDLSFIKSDFVIIAVTFFVISLVFMVLIYRKFQ